MLNYVKIVLAILKAGLPLPDFRIAGEVEKWLVAIAPVIANLIADLATKVTPENPLVVGDADPVAIRAAVMEQIQSDPAIVGKLGDGVLLEKLIDALVKLLPVILPLFIKTT